MTKKFFLIVFLGLIFNLQTTLGQNLIDLANFRFYSYREQSWRGFIKLSDTISLIYSSDQIVLLDPGNIQRSSLTLPKARGFGIQNVIRLGNDVISVAYMTSSRVNSSASYLIHLKNLNLHISDRMDLKELVIDSDLREQRYFRLFCLEDGFLFQKHRGFDLYDSNMTRIAKIEPNTVVRTRISKMPRISSGSEFIVSFPTNRTAFQVGKDGLMEISFGKGENAVSLEIDSFNNSRYLVDYGGKAEFTIYRFSDRSYQSPLFSSLGVVRQIYHDVVYIYWENVVYAVPIMGPWDKAVILDEMSVETDY